MQFLTKALSGLFLVALTAGLLGYAAQSVRWALDERANREPGERQASERVFAAQVVTYDAETVRPVLETFGEVLSRQTLELRASAAGRLVELGPGVEEGGQVAAGQLIARIDPAEAERARRRAEADLEDARAEVEDAETARQIAADDLDSARAQADLRSRALDRQRDLETRGVGTAASVEEAELASATSDQQVLSRRRTLADAEARVAQARTALTRGRIALEEAERGVDDTSVTAAFDGTLSDLSVTVGGLVGQNERLAELIDPADLEVSFQVSTAEYARLSGAEGGVVGTEASVRLDAGGGGVASAATITREAASIAEGETGRRLFARLSDPSGFRPGDFVSVLVTEPALEGVAVLPAAAVDAGGSLLALDAEDRLEVVPGTLLRRQGDDVIVRAEGLDGRRVVAERSASLGAGIRVRPITPAAPEAGEPDLVELSADRRAVLIARVEADAAMPDEAKARVLAKLRDDRVPAGMVQRIENGGDRASP